MNGIKSELNGGTSDDTENKFDDLERFGNLKESEYLHTREGVECVLEYYDKLVPSCEDSSLWASKLPENKRRAIRNFENDPPDFAQDKGPSAALLECLAAEALLERAWVISPSDNPIKVQRAHDWDDYNHHVDCVVSVPMPKFSPYFALDITTDGGAPGDNHDKVSEKIAKGNNGSTPKNPFNEPNFFGFTRVDLYGPTEKDGNLVPGRPVEHIPRFVLGLSKNEVIDTMNDPEATQIKWPGHLGVPESIALLPKSERHRKISFKILSEINAQADLFGMMLPEKWPGHEREIAEAKQDLSHIRAHTFNALADFFILEPEAKRLQQEGNNRELLRYLDRRIRERQEECIKEEQVDFRQQKRIDPNAHKPPFSEIMQTTWEYMHGFNENPQIKKNYSMPKVRSDPAYVSQIFTEVHSFSPD